MGDSAYSSLRGSPASFPDTPEFDYDVYVFYADADKDTALKFVEFMETPRYKLKMYFRGRDPLDEFDGNVESIKTKCRRMVTFLTPSFLESPQFELLSKLVATLTPDECEKLLNPVLLLPCDIPPILSKVSITDFTTDGLQGRMWERLVVSLIPGPKLSNFVSLLSKVPLRMEEFPTVVNGRIAEIPKVDFDLEEEPTPVFKK